MARERHRQRKEEPGREQQEKVAEATPLEPREPPNLGMGKLALRKLRWYCRSHSGNIRFGIVRKSKLCKSHRARLAR